MTAAMEELRSRNTYGCETYAPPYICSYAIHGFNIMNQGRKIYWEGAKIPNMRLHIVFVAPPGGMKSHYLQVMGLDDHSIFKDCTFDMVQRQDVNTASLFGTFKPMGNGTYEKREGEAQKYSNGFILFDEFKALTESMRQSFNASMDTQLLTALDSGKVTKSMAADNIEYETRFTLWGGVQPAKYDLSSGMGRRICFLLNIPTREQKEELKLAVWKSINKRPNVRNIQELHNNIRAWVEKFKEIETIEYDESIFHLYNKLDIEPFEITSYGKLILGYHLAKFGPDKNMMLDVEDKSLYEMITNQFKWRKDIIDGADTMQIAQLIRDNGDDHEGVKIISRQKLNTLCYSIQMSVKDVNAKIEEMRKCSMISIRGQDITLLC